MEKLRLLSLFAGIGGFELGLERSGGFQTVAQCEIDDDCQRVLALRWPNVRRYHDIRELTAARLRDDGIFPNAICGGFPCQPFSHAGKRLGTKDDRHLWPEMVRVIAELKPNVVFGENVAGLTSMVESRRFVGVESRTGGRTPDGFDYEATLLYEERMLLDSIREDLEAIGYYVQPFAFPACGVGAPHRRERLGIVAHARLQQPQDALPDRCGARMDRQGAPKWGESDGAASGRCGVLADTNNLSHPGELAARTRSGKAGQGEGSNAGKRKASDGQRVRSASGARREDVANGTGERWGEAGKHSQRSEERASGRCDVSDSNSLDAQGRLSRRADAQIRGVESERPTGLQGAFNGGDCGSEPGLGRGFNGVSSWLDGSWEHDVPRVAVNVPNRAPRLKQLGNSVVPAWAEALGRAYLQAMEAA